MRGGTSEMEQLMVNRSHNHAFAPPLHRAARRARCTFTTAATPDQITLDDTPAESLLLSKGITYRQLLSQSDFRSPGIARHTCSATKPDCRLQRTFGLLRWIHARVGRLVSLLWTARTALEHSDCAFHSSSHHALGLAAAWSGYAPTINIPRT